MSETHGTPWRYRTGCRCDACKAAQAAKCSRDRAKRRARAATPPEHGLAGYGNYGCRCEVCVEANRTMSAEYRRDPEQYDRLRQDSQRRHAQAQRASLDTATRYGYQWTGPELEIVCRDDLTAAEMAALLGRTVAAVSTKRKRIHQAEPAPSWLAGKRSRLH